MSDALTIPQTFAGKLGAADVTNTLKRKQLMSVQFALQNATVTNLMPPFILSTRKAVLEQVRFSFDVLNTFANNVVFEIYDETNSASLGTETIVGGYGGTGQKYETLTVSSANASIAALLKIKVFLTITQVDYDKMDDFTVILQYREDLD